MKGRIGDSTEIDVEIDSLKIAYAAMKRALIEIEFKSLKSSENEGDE